MTKQEAKEAMKDGKQVTHKYFAPGEWMTIAANGLIIFEDGSKINPNVFWGCRELKGWEDGYEIFKP